MERYDLLCAAIIERALLDYRLAQKNIRKNYDTAASKAIIREVERFLKSPWFRVLSDLDGRKPIELMEGE